MDSAPQLDSALLFMFISLTGVVLLVMRYMPHLFTRVPFVEPRAAHGVMAEETEMVVIDIRPPHEFAGGWGHLPGAVNLPAWELRRKLKEIGADLAPYREQTVLVVCRSGIDAPRAVRILKRSGFTNLAVLKGGMKRWNKEGLPVEGGSNG